MCRIYRAFLSCLLAISKKQFTVPQKREPLVCVYKTWRDVYWLRVINAEFYEGHSIKHGRLYVYAILNARISSYAICPIRVLVC